MAPSGGMSSSTVAAELMEWARAVLHLRRVPELKVFKKLCRGPGLTRAFSVLISELSPNSYKLDAPADGASPASEATLTLRRQRDELREEVEREKEDIDRVTRKLRSLDRAISLATSTAADSAAREEQVRCLRVQQANEAAFVRLLTDQIVTVAREISESKPHIVDKSDTDLPMSAVHLSPSAEQVENQMVNRLAKTHVELREVEVRDIDAHLEELNRTNKQTADAIRKLDQELESNDRSILQQNIRLIQQENKLMALLKVLLERNGRIKENQASNTEHLVPLARRRLQEVAASHQREIEAIKSSRLVSSLQEETGASLFACCSESTNSLSIPIATLGQLQLEMTRLRPLTERSKASRGRVDMFSTWERRQVARLNALKEKNQGQKDDEVHSLARGTLLAARNSASGSADHLVDVAWTRLEDVHCKKARQALNELQFAIRGDSLEKWEKRLARAGAF